MRSLISHGDFPTARKFCYLNTANVSLTYSKAKTVNEEWFKDIAHNGSNNFTENTEEIVFDGIHKSAAEFINARPNEIAGGSSATELLSSLAWSIAPKKGQNIVSTTSAFPSTVYPWLRVARSTGAEIKLAESKNGFSSLGAICNLINNKTDTTN